MFNTKAVPKSVDFYGFFGVCGFFWQNGNTGLTSVQSHHGSASVEYEFQKYNLLLIVYYNIIPKHLQPNFLILLAELYFKTAIGV